MSNIKMEIAVTVAILGASVAAQAQIRPAYGFPAESKSGVQLGDSALWFTPYVGAAIGRDDNLFMSSNNEKTSTYYLLSPGFGLDARTNRTAFQMKYQGQIGRYAQSDDDNYVDHTARALFDVAFDRRNFLRIGMDYIRSHDPRGSTDRPISGRPDQYRITSPNVTYAFGTPGAAGRVEVYASEADKRYLNNRATTAASDRETREAGGAFYWRVAPKTYVLAEARYTGIDYRQAGIPAEGEERRFYGGVSWDATAVTSGTLKVGRMERKFDLGGEDTSTSWEGTVVWMPRTYSKLDFYTSRQTNESTGLGRFILSSIGGVAWTHAWSSYLSTGLDLRYQKDDYRGFDRKDEIKSIGLRAGYKMRRWLTLGAEWNHSTRDSNLPVFEYDKNLYLLTATASM
jgi:hypothetical protein